MTRIAIRRTNRRVSISPHIIATKDQDGKRGNVVLTHFTNVGDWIDDEKDIVVDPGSNVKVYSDAYYVRSWEKYGDELSKPGVFDKLAKWVRRQK